MYTVYRPYVAEGSIFTIKVCKVNINDSSERHISVQTLRWLDNLTMRILLS